MAQSGVSCGCGQVLFETDRYKAGETINCPWCERKYRYLGDDKIESLDARPSDNSVNSANSANLAQEATASKGRVRVPQRNTGNRETRREASVSARSAENVEGRSSGKSARAASVSMRGKREGIPGGLTMTIVFIVGFNALAFIALYFFLPRQPDGIRLPMWGGEPIPKGVIWPELAALVVGHVVGFIVWACYAYILDRLNRLSRRELQNLDGKD